MTDLGPLPTSIAEPCITVDGVNYTESHIRLLAKIAQEADEAKHLLRSAGFGYTGLSLLRTVREEVLDIPMED